MVEGRDRRPELGYKLAMELKSIVSGKSNQNVLAQSESSQYLIMFSHSTDIVLTRVCLFLQVNGACILGSELEQKKCVVFDNQNDYQSYSFVPQGWKILNISSVFIMYYV